jgi:hypothetical protein
MPHKGHLGNAAIRMVPTLGAVAVVEPSSSRSAGPPSLPLVVALTTGPAIQGNNVVYCVSSLIEGAD